MAKGGNEFEYRVEGTADFSELQKELNRLNTALANSRGSITAFKEEIEREAKGKSEYKIVIRSDFNDSGTKVAKAEIVEVNKAYDGLLNKLRQIEKEPQKNSLTSLRQQVNAAKQARDAVSQYSTSFDGLGNKIRSLNPDWVSLNQKAENFKRELDIAASSNIWQRLTAEYGLRGLSTAGRQITDFVNVFQSLSIVVGQVTAAINTVVGALANLQSFNLSFKAIESGAAGGAQALAESSRIALNLGTDLVTVRAGFQQLSPVILNTGGTISDVSNVVETLSSRFAAFGLSGDKARRVTNGIIQAFSKGKLMSEELTQQISEADPAFRTDLAGALEISTAELEKQVKAGKITGKVLLENLPKLSKSALLYGKLGNSAADAAVALRKGAVTIDQVSNKIKGLNQLSLEKLAKAIEPILFVFIEIGASITDFVNRVSKLDVIKTIGTILGAIGSQVNTVVTAFLNAAEAIINVADSVNKFIGPFLQIPGVAQLAGLALTSKLIAPLQNIKNKFLEGSKGAGGFVGAIRALSTFQNLGTAIDNNLIQPIRKFGEVTTRTIQTTSLSTAFRRIAFGSLYARDELKKLTDSQGVLTDKFQRSGEIIDKIKDRLRGYQDQLNALETRRAVNPAAFPGGKEIDDLNQKINRANADIERATRLQSSYAARLQQNVKETDRLAASTTIFQRSLNGLKGVLGGVRAGVLGLFSALGPLGVLLLAIGAAQGAYQNAVADSNAILEQSKDTIDTVRKAIEDLNGGVKQAEKPLEGWALAWLTIGNFIAGIVEGLTRLLDGLAKTLQKVTKGADGFASRALLVLGFAATGAIVGSAFTPLGAVIGGVAAAVAAYALTSDAAAQQAYKNARSAEALKTSFAAIVPEVQKLGKELDKLKANAPLSVKAPGSDARNKLIQGYQQEKAAILELQKIADQQKNTENDLRGKLEGARKEVTKYAQATVDLKAKRDKLVRDRDKFNYGSKEYTLATRDINRLNFEIMENARSFQRAKAGVKTYNDELYAAAKAAGYSEKKIAELKKANEGRRIELGFALETDDKINSIQEIQDQIKLLQEDVKNLDLLNPQSLKTLDVALTKIKAFEFITEKLSKTKVEIEVELRNLQQEISESRLQIALEPGALREASIQVSKITNEFADAQTKLKQTTDYIRFAAEQGTLSAQDQKRLLKEAGLEFVSASLKAKGAIVDAAREFKKQLAEAKSTYQSLVLSKPEFFTPGEFRKNGQQIEKDYRKTLERIRKETGDYTFTPQVEGKTVAETLANKKAFTDTRNEADDLKKSIRQLSSVLDLLARTLAKIGGVSFEDLKKLQSKDFQGINLNELEKSAYEAQKAVTGVDAAAQGAAKSYGKVTDSAVVGGIKYVSATEKSTGAVEWLTEAEYKAAKQAERLGKKGAEATGQVAEGAQAAATAVGNIDKAAKTVVGTIKGLGGEEIFLVEDDYTGKVESLTAAQLKQQGIVNTLNQSYKDLSISISGAAAATSEYLKKQQSELQAAGPQAISVGENIGLPPGLTREVMDAGRRAGGDWLKAWTDTVSNDGLFSTMVLNSMQNASDRYKFAMSGMQTAASDLQNAQNAYNQALQTGQGDLIMLGAQLENANAIMDQQSYELKEATTEYNNASSSARQLGIDINTVLGAGQFINDTGPKTLEEAYDRARQSVLEFGGAADDINGADFKQLDESSGGANQSLQDASGALRDGSTAAVSVAGSLDEARLAAEGITNALDALDGKQIDVNVNVSGSTIPGLWTGGPTEGGRTYRINELGKEGFLSPSGTLSPINKPKNALWRAPSKGMVIPAHIMAGLDLPASKVSTRVRPASVSGGNGLIKIARAIQASLSTKSAPDRSMDEMATVQAHQAHQIGKLSRAVNKLVDKDWNVNVGIRSNDNTTYLQALNRMM